MFKELEELAKKWGFDIINPKLGIDSDKVIKLKITMIKVIESDKEVNNLKDAFCNWI